MRNLLKELAENCKKGCSECPYLDSPTGECMVMVNIDRWGSMAHLDEVECGRYENDSEV